MKRKLFIALLSTGIFYVSPVFAEKTDSTRVSSEEKALEEVVVTATRTPKALKDVPVVTHVLNAEELKKADATNIQDLLTEEIPGLEFGFAMSQETSLRMSGFGGNAILFLIDGERMAGETMDNVDYNRLNLEDIGQVEIVKGAASSLYGANAVGGVINLISKQNRKPWYVNINSRYKNIGDEWRIGGNIGFNAGKWNSTTSAQFNTSKTIRLTSPFDTESKIHQIYGGFVINLKERIIFTLNNKLKFIARGGYFHRTSDRSNYTDRYVDYSGGLKGIWDIDKSQNFEISYSFDQYDKARYINHTRIHDHDYSNLQHIIHAIYIKQWGTNILTAGSDYMYDYLTTYQFTDNSFHSQNSVDAFVQFDYSPLTWLNLVGSIRDDYYSESDNNALTGRLTIMFRPRLLTIRLGYSGGFRAPTLKEMYMNFDMAGIQIIYGNPYLKPEKSHNFNLALERTGQLKGGIFQGSYSASISAYFNYYNSRITTAEFIPKENDNREEGAIYENEKGVKVGGIDFNLRYRSLLGIGASINYNYLRIAGRIIDSQFSAPRDHSATWRLDYEKHICKFYRLYASISGRYLSKPESRYESDSAYQIWKFTLQQTVRKGITVNFIIDNIFNYRPKVYYWNSAPTTGISWSLGVSLDMDQIFSK